MKTYIQHSAPHPGEMLKEPYFKPLKLSVKDAADRFNISKSELLFIVNRRKEVSVGIAVKLAQAFKTTTQYWLNMPSNYNLSNTIEE